MTQETRKLFTAARYVDRIHTDRRCRYLRRKRALEYEVPAERRFLTSELCSACAGHLAAEGL